MKKQKLMLSLCFIGMFATSIMAQTSMPVAGGDATGKDGSASYSVGQLVYSASTGVNGSSSEGVQQAYEVFVVSGIKSFNDISLECTVYPNPAVDFVKLKVENNPIDNLSYQLFNDTGILLQNKKLESTETFISLEGLASSTYLIKVSNRKRVVKIFKIVKN